MLYLNPAPAGACEAPESGALMRGVKFLEDKGEPAGQWAIKHCSICGNLAMFSVAICSLWQFRNVFSVAISQCVL